MCITCHHQLQTLLGVTVGIEFGTITLGNIDLLQAVLGVIVGALQLAVQLLHLSSRLNGRRESLKKNALHFAICSSED